MAPAQCSRLVGASGLSVDAFEAQSLQGQQNDLQTVESL